LLTVWIIWPDFGRVSFPDGNAQPVGVAVHVPGVKLSVEVERGRDAGVPQDFVLGLERGF
jgi:hypothetical protein